MGGPENPDFVETGNLVLWREVDGQRRGLACLVTCCPNPGCDCQEVQLQAFEVDDRFEGITTRGEEAGVIHRSRPDEPPPPSRQVAALVDLETGQVGQDEECPARLRQPELIGWLREMLDADALEELRGYRRHVKDQGRMDQADLASGAWRERDWTSWDGKEPVAWIGASAAPPDVYELDGERYEAADTYCISETCDCQDVRVSFLPERRQDGSVARTVYVDAATAEVVGTAHPPGERERLGRLWEAFAARRDVRELGRRWRLMQGLAPEIHALRHEQLIPKTVRRERRVGRNDPCPCGSGKKYKRCCLAREHA